MLLLSAAPSHGLSAGHVRYLCLEQGAGSAGVNLLINAAIAWALVRSLPTVPLWGQPSIAGDTVATTFLLPFLTCLIVTPLVRRQVRRGRVPPLDRAGGVARLAAFLPGATLARALAFGLLSLVLVAPVALWGLAALGIDELCAPGFILFKALFAAGLAGAVTPLIALRALPDAALAG